MKFYSEVTNQKYDTQKECEDAEFEFKIKTEKEEAEKAKKAQARKDAAHRVEEARDEFIAAKKNYEDVLSEFLKNYGSYHTTINKEMINDMPSLFDLMDKLFF